MDGCSPLVFLLLLSRDGGSDRSSTLDTRDPLILLLLCSALGQEGGPSPGSAPEQYQSQGWNAWGGSNFQSLLLVLLLTRSTTASAAD